MLLHSSGALCLYAWLKAMVGFFFFFFSRFSKCFENVATMFLLHRPNVEDVSIVLFFVSLTLSFNYFFASSSLSFSHLLCNSLTMAHHFLSFIVARFVAQNRSLPPRTLVSFSLIFRFC